MNDKKDKFLTESDKYGIHQQLLNPLGEKLAPLIGPVCLETFEDFRKRDEQREKDGFWKNITYKRIPKKDGSVVVIPVTIEHKLVHGPFDPKEESGGESGQGEGEEGDELGEQDVNEDGEGECEGDGDPRAGDGSGGEHGIEEEEDYKIGEKLTKEFELPDLKDKGKKFPVNEYVYDLTSRNVGSGQVVDKKATLKQIIRTNLGLGILDKDNIKPSRFLVGPKDKIFRVLSRERAYKSKAVVFFVRDYSGSMSGNPTIAVVNQHKMIYQWLLWQYDKMVIPRFILHDTEAKEVDSFGMYLRLKVAGGTIIQSAYELVNEIIEKESLWDYNIYVFQGTDGDDWDSDGSQTIPELKKLLSYVNHMGALVVHNEWMNRWRKQQGQNSTDFEDYIKKSSLLKTNLRMTVIKESQATDEKALIKSIKRIIS